MKTVRRLWCFAPCLLALILVVLLLPVHQDHRLSCKNEKADTYTVNLGPDLSTCHETSTGPIFVPNRTTHMVNCCPTEPDSSKPVIDFKLPDPSSPLRLRRPAHRVDADYIAKYNKAVEIMKSLPSDHPHSYARQANIHCLYCSGSYFQADVTAKIPFHIHETWLFFPFHRYYVYFHERILGKLINDDTFALPYWNYDSPEGMPIPEIYMKGELYDQDRDFRHLPPVPADINYTPDKVYLNSEPVKEQVANNLAIMYNHMISGATKPELFMGCRLESGKDGAECSEGGYTGGTMENAPHNTIHLWTGNILKNGLEDMGTLYHAAYDPIFYAHHANLYRMWEIWRKLNGYKESAPEFEDDLWLDSYFYFYDEDLNLVKVSVRDSLDATKLRYAYEDVKLPWLDAQPRPSMDPKIARDILRSDSDNVLRMATNKGPWTLENTVRVRVTRPMKTRAKEEEEILVIRDISVKNDTYAKFDVYINLIDEANASPKMREFAGCYVKMQGGGLLKGKSHIKKLGISEILRDLEADGDDSIWVSLVPTGQTGSAITLQELRIEYMK